MKMPLPPFEKALSSVMAQVKGEFSDLLVGTLLGGSVAFGKATARSDLDIFVVIHDSWQQRRTLLIDTVEVELFINPVFLIEEGITSTDPNVSFSILAMFAHGRILYDPHGVILHLVKQAKERWKQERPPLDKGDIPRLRYYLNDLLKDTQDAAEKEDLTATYLLSLTVQTALNVHYKLQRWWPVKPKYLFSTLKQHDTEMAKLVQELLLENTLPWQERCQKLSILVESVLRPVGGTLTEWKTPKEKVVPKKQKT